MTRKYTISDPDQVRQAYASYTSERNYEPGDLIRWKRGMKNRRFPEYDMPVVCIAVGQENMPEHMCMPKEDDGGPYFAENRDMIFGIIRDDDDGMGPTFMLFSADQRAFTLYEE